MSVSSSPPLSSGKQAPLPRPPHPSSSSSNSITGYNIRARVSQQASQVGNREYWSSWKASARQKAAEYIPRSLRAAEGQAEDPQTSAGIATHIAPKVYAPYQSRQNTQSTDLQSPSLSPRRAFSTLPSDGTFLSPAEEVYPVLLPGYTFTRRNGEGGEELIVTLRGFVARKPAIHGRAQRMFNLMARQLARLPKPLSASSTSLLLHASPTSTDDSHFFPSIPQGWASSSSGRTTPSGADIHTEDQYQRQHLSERIVESITDQMHEETLGKLVSKLGALPIDGAGGVHEEHNMGQDEQVQQTTVTGSNFHASRPTHVDVSEPVQQAMGRATPVEAVHAGPETPSELALVSSSSTSLASKATCNIASTSSDSAAPSSASSSSAGAASATSRMAKLRRITPSRSPSSASLQALSPNSSNTADSQLVGGSQTWATRTLDEIRQLTANLNERLNDFWIYRVALRTVRVEIQGDFVESGKNERSWQTLLAQELKSDTNGMFRLRVNLGPLGVFEDRLQGLRTRAVLLEDVSPRSTHAALEAVVTPPPKTEWCPLDLARSTATEAPLRLISDVDDTIRQTCVVQGLKSVFRQVFILPHHEVIVPGMAEWYHSLAHSHHIGIHFVSNAPIELWKPIKQFLHHAGMPAGHLHLKSYNSEVEGATTTANAHHQEQDGREESDSGSVAGGRQQPLGNSAAAKGSLLSTWLQPASARKRAAIVSILNDFPETGFLLVGDTGELDLELYSELAQERPHQIKALYLRDVTSDSGYAGPTSAREDLSIDKDKKSRLTTARKAGEAMKRPVKAFAEGTRPRNGSNSGGNGSGNNRPTSPTMRRVMGGDEQQRLAESTKSPSNPDSTPRLPRQALPEPLSQPSGETGSGINSKSPITSSIPAAVAAPRTLSIPRTADPHLCTASSTSASSRLVKRSPALQLRINKALSILPPHVEFHLFTEGEEVRGECERLVGEIRSGRR